MNTLKHDCVIACLKVTCMMCIVLPKAPRSLEILGSLPSLMSSFVYVGNSRLVGGLPLRPNKLAEVESSDQRARRPNL